MVIVDSRLGPMVGKAPWWSWLPSWFGGLTNNFSLFNKLPKETIRSEKAVTSHPFDQLPQIMKPREKSISEKGQRVFAGEEIKKKTFQKWHLLFLFVAIQTDEENVSQTILLFLLS